MNQTHIHLIITHLPIFGSLLGGIVLVHGLLTKTKQTLIAAYILLIISSLGAGIAYLTGEGAEEGVEKIPGIVKSMIGQHEEVALIALISLILLGISSIFGIFFSPDKKKLEIILRKKFRYDIEVIIRKDNIKNSIRENLEEHIKLFKPSLIAMFTDQDRSIFKNYFTQVKPNNCHLLLRSLS